MWPCLICREFVSTVKRSRRRRWRSIRLASASPFLLGPFCFLRKLCQKQFPEQSVHSSCRDVPNSKNPPAVVYLISNFCARQTRTGFSWSSWDDRLQCVVCVACVVCVVCVACVACLVCVVCVLLSINGRGLHWTRGGVSCEAETAQCTS